MRGEYTRVGAKIRSGSNSNKPPYERGSLPAVPPQPDQPPSSSPSSRASSPSSSLVLFPVPVYLRVITTISSWLTLAGYTVFAVIFTSTDPENVRMSRNGITALASVLLTVGYVGGAAALLTLLAVSRSHYYYRSHSHSHCQARRVVQYDTILSPFLLTSVAGLLEIGLNIGLHRSFPVVGSVGSGYIYGPLVAACLTTVVFALLSFLAYSCQEPPGRGFYQRRRSKQEPQRQQFRPMDIISRHSSRNNNSNNNNHIANQIRGGASPLVRRQQDGTAIATVTAAARGSSRPYARYEMPRFPPGAAANTPGAAFGNMPGITTVTTGGAPHTTTVTTTIPIITPTSATPTPAAAQGENNNNNNNSEDEYINDMIPSDEAQRRQLLRLLLAREQDSRQAAAMSTTYHIDWPGCSIGGSSLGDDGDGGGDNARGRGRGRVCPRRGGGRENPPSTPGHHHQPGQEQEQQEQQQQQALSRALSVPDLAVAAAVVAAASANMPVSPSLPPPPPSPSTPSSSTTTTTPSNRMKSRRRTSISNQWDIRNLLGNGEHGNTV